MRKNRQFAIYLFRVIPTSLLSRIFGFITQIPVSAKTMDSLISWYSKKYSVNTDEYIIPKEGFRNFNSFFTRQLKKGMRPVDRTAGAVVSPVDGRIDEFGKIKGSSIMQAKEIDYSLYDLIPSESAEKYEGGSFITLYLSPGDYHRIHSPLSGKITGYFHIPGKLFTVQEFMVGGLPGLFSKNERLISYIKAPRTECAVCKIGAMNVGRISISHGSIITNRTIRTKHEVHYLKGSEVKTKAGDELGIFHLGSTVILLFTRGTVKFKGIKRGMKVKMGSKIAELA